MPELPEVETIVRSLQSGGRDAPAVAGRVILRGQVLWPGTIATPGSSEFAGQVSGQRIEWVDRRGTFVYFHLSQDALLIHLRMSGDIRVEPLPAGGGEDGVQTHDRVVFDLEGGLRMSFNDTRKFGRTWLVHDAQTVLGDLGPEPLDESLTPQEFARMLRGRRRQIKPLLLDQTFLAGLGNIYSDEALHLARIHPLASADALTSADAARLLEAIRAVLTEGIRRNGASIDWVYRGGSFQNSFRVYGRTGEACPVCGTPIQRILVGQRSTHYCPVCQPDPSGRTIMKGR
jgi:formamidopyrimidine-DNA glycosylase